MLENISELKEACEINFEIILGKFPRAEINYFRRTWTKAEIILK